MHQLNVIVPHHCKLQSRSCFWSVCCNDMTPDLDTPSKGFQYSLLHITQNKVTNIHHKMKDFQGPELLLIKFEDCQGSV